MEPKEKKLIEYNRLKREAAVSKKQRVFGIASDEINDLSEYNLKLIGIALYWAEGYKTDLARDVEFVNSDPFMIKLMMRWLRDICGVSENKFKIRIQIHDASKIEEGIKFWSLCTKVHPKQFTKPYIKISPSSKRKIGNRHPYGVCHIRIADTNLLAKIKGWIRGISVASSSSPV